MKIVTINLLSDLSRWPQRMPLLVQGLAELSPDVVCLQEVKLPQNTARQLADALGYPHIILYRKTGIEAGSEAIALLSRLPVEEQATLNLKYQNRVAQYIRVSEAGSTVVIANVHLFWQPGESEARLRQVRRLLEWLQGLPGEPPTVICGDFNSTPETRPILRMLQSHDSAFVRVHGQEPEYTCPTPLPRAATASLRTLLGFFFLLRPKHLSMRWKGVLDYIFVDRRLKVTDCRLVLNTPSPTDPRIYPSDHFGLFAQIET